MTKNDSQQPGSRIDPEVARKAGNRGDDADRDPGRDGGDDSGHDPGHGPGHDRGDNLAAGLRREQQALLQANVRASNLPTLLVGVLFAAFYSYFEGLHEGWLWWGVLAFVLGLRILAGRRESSPAMLLSLLFVTGCLWGAAPLLVVQLAGYDTLFTALLLAVGIAIAAFGSYGMDPRAAAAVTVPIGLVIVVVCAVSGSPSLYAVAITLPMLYVHQFFVVARSRRVLANQIRLRLENDQLVEQLSAHADKTSAELDRRLETERMLRASRDRAERMSATDALTEIANRRYFDRRLEQEVSRAFRDRSVLSLVICDIDYFKQFNDAYGHQAGDECLKAFARVLTTYCRRGGDLAARIGGEEFALLLPTTDHAAALRLAEQARAAFDELAVAHRDSKVSGNATASFGVSSITPEDLGAGEGLLRQADRALYLAKERGRNRVVSENDIDTVAEQG